MKGIVFTEFMEMVENKWEMDMVDDLIDAVDPESGGSYTSVGTYEYGELVEYVKELNRRTDIAIPDLIHAFGNYLAGSFSRKFTDFFHEAENTFELLKKVDNHIHVEVRKLYSDAELPEFSYDEKDDNTLILHYQSSRNLPDLAHGLIEGCADYFGETITIAREGKSDNGMIKEEFTLTRQN